MPPPLIIALIVVLPLSMVALGTYLGSTNLHSSTLGLIAFAAAGILSTLFYFAVSGRLG